MTSPSAPEKEFAHPRQTMRAVVKARPERGAEFVDSYAERQLAAGEVRIQIAAASVCGTDRELYEYSPMAQAFTLNIPVVLGHECAGTVIEVGPGVDSLAIGDRVALESHVACWDCYPCDTGNAHNCLNMQLLGLHLDGGFAERLAIPATACFKLHPDFPLEQGALLEPAGVAMHAIQRSKIDLAGADVVISGGGPVGLFIAAISRAMGAGNVVVIEPNAYRRGLIEELGATSLTPGDDVIGTCRRLSGAKFGFDVAFEASGVPAALPPLLEALRKEATVVAVGIPGRPLELDVAAYLIKKGLTFTGSFGRALWGTWENIADLVASGQLDLSKFITHRLPLSALDEAIELLSQESCKVLLIPGLPDGSDTISKGDA
ncbi:zinc-dependent alcohol dehydrogenase [Pseudarthrobacter sulfonivorans]|uniref:zinc-dependent alcohol dehydrogenase n=1 Tax=Pseudarthrobacter sulfonivorans TaxID=121292 RepID=UPI00277DC341|nr:alcohol dehydrogenase catalytic domain-containing protein [Pseudarthrobacter sulfonivorans]MDQ0000605.1 threonine 3-dehydrogenase [Pseudarthrobacter sulfonivorans]